MVPGRNEIFGSVDGGSGVEGGTTIATAWCARCRKVASPVDAVKPCPTCGDPLALRDWPVAALEVGVTARQFEAEVRRRARAAYITLQREDPTEAEAMRSQYMGDFEAGHYNWDTKFDRDKNKVQKALWKTWGFLHFMYLLMRRCDSSMTEELALEICTWNNADAIAVQLWALGIVGNPKDPTPDKTSGAGSNEKSDNKTTETGSPTTKLSRGQLDAILKEAAEARSPGGSGVVLPAVEETFA